MKFKINTTLEILEQTPKTLKVLLGNLSDEWIYSNEGDKTLSAYLSILNQ